MSAAVPRPLAPDHPRAIEIADRIWWVGCTTPEGLDHRHAYLIEQGDQSVLVNPGPRICLPRVREKVEQIVPFAQVRWFLCPHQDPDTASAMISVDEANTRSDAAIIADTEASECLRHYGLGMPVQLPDAHGWRLLLQDRALSLIALPYAPRAGALCAFDKRTGVLFSGDLFSSFDSSEMLFASEPVHLGGMVPYHQRAMPSGTALDHALRRVEYLPIRLVAAKRGPLIPQSLVGEAIGRLRSLKCGIHLLSDQEPDVQRAWDLADIMHRITDTMLLQRDFGDIARQLLTLMQPILPAAHIDYFALLDDGTILKLDPERDFAGVAGSDRPYVCDFIGKSRAEWLATHARDRRFRAHVLHGERFCVQPDMAHGAADGGTVVTLPLCARGDDLIEALAVMRLPPAVRITELAARLIERVAEPLQVALEREVSYRRLDIARERAYRRSIRDPLTGLFTRFYMQDVLARQCALHGRDPSATLSVSLLDIDHFKQVNDTHGHLAGDRVLAGLAALLQQNCRDTDILVRYGGEEILVASIGQDIAGAAQLAERLQDMIARTPIAIDESGQEQLRVTVSIGVAEHRQGETLEAAIQRADRALYEAKEQGRNRVRLEPLAAPDGMPMGHWAPPEGG